MLSAPSSFARDAFRLHTSRARTNEFRLLIALIAPMAWSSGCTTPPSPPMLRGGRLARIETVPAGALLVSRAGEVFRTPTTLALPDHSIEYYEIRLPGHATRRIALDYPRDPTPLQAMSMCTLVPLIAEAGWERVRPVNGLARIVLVRGPDD